MYTFDLAIFARQFLLCIFFSRFFRSTSFTSPCTILDVFVFIIVLKRKKLFYYFINFHRHIFEIFLNGKYMTSNSRTILLFFGWETDLHKRNNAVCKNFYRMMFGANIHCILCHLKWRLFSFLLEWSVILCHIIHTLVQFALG